MEGIMLKHGERCLREQAELVSVIQTFCSLVQWQSFAKR